MSVSPCVYRLCPNPQTWLCRNRHVVSPNGIVDRKVCVSCGYWQAFDGRNEVPGHQNASARPPSAARLFAIPAASLLRDPSSSHKSAYVRLLADAFEADLVLLESEEELIPLVERRKPELLLTMNFPWYERFSIRPIQQLPRQLPIVTVHDDCRRQMHAQLDEVLRRSVAVISPVCSPVLASDQFPEIAHKLLWLPYFIPNSVPTYQINENPTLKCLLPGFISKSYPLRQRALRDVSRRLLDRMPHPGYWRADYSDAIVGVDYFNYLHRYLAILTCGSIYRCVVAKYLEAPYCGALLIAESVPDLVEMGFCPGVHYVAIEHSTNLSTLLEGIIRDASEVLQIRINGMSLVHSRHSEAARWPDACRVARNALSFAGLA